MDADEHAPGPPLPRVSILCHDLSTNALGRSLLLAELLDGLTEVEIAGVHSGPDLWAPARGHPVPIRVGPRVEDSTGLALARAWLADLPLGDVLLVSKPMPTSLGLVRSTTLSRTVAVALDIDDWEYGLCRATPRPLAHALALAAGPLIRQRPNHVARIRRLERHVAAIPHRLVSNAWLRDRFGGTVLYHVRDPEQLDPARVDRRAARAGLELDERVWVGFVGTYRPHKGVDDLVAALAAIEGDRAPGLLLVGMDTESREVRTLLTSAAAQLGAERLRVTGTVPLADLPAHVCAADIIAIPSKRSRASAGQIPAKLFDAMALARPVVATAVNDVPDILAGCGRVVAPGEVWALTRAIEELATDPEQRARLGAAARARLCSHYSYRQGRAVLAEFLRGLGR
ncbi:MAG: glycosyltransferase [Planctomycetes bacterium]|nr:glycosyltransferase [Planctomycetota bacterium]